MLSVNEDSETPKAILKQLDEGELAIYDCLQTDFGNDSVLPFTAKLESVVEVPDFKGGVRKYMRMTNLLQDFRSPKVLDVKLGTRTFSEDECKNPKLRSDLYERMLKLYPSQVTEEDRAKGGITKLRWMTMRDMSSTIRSLGFRIDGKAGFRRRQSCDLNEELTRLRQRHEVCDEFCTFAKVAATDDGREPNGISAIELAERILEVLQRMHAAFENSAFVRDHECIGSSLLFALDAYGKAGVFWIDFGKTRRLPDGLKVTHRNTWEPGNHEDGLLTGLDNMVLAWGDVLQMLRRDRAASGWTGTSRRRSFCGHFEPQLPPAPEDNPLEDSEDRPSLLVSTTVSLKGIEKVVKRKQVNMKRSRSSPLLDFNSSAPEWASELPADTAGMIEVPRKLEVATVTQTIIWKAFRNIIYTLCGLFCLSCPQEPWW